MPPPPIYHPAPAWAPPRSQVMRLYHGCTSQDEASIRKTGIDLSKCRPDTDFGQGFYTTTVLYQAKQWAVARHYELAARRVVSPPVVLTFVVDRFDLSALHTIKFVLGGRSKVNFWSLVQHCRQSTATSLNDHRGPVRRSDGTRWYDLVCGPVSAFWRQRYAMQDADQFSFHTAAGVRVPQRLIDAGGPSTFSSQPVWRP